MVRYRGNGGLTGVKNTANATIGGGFFARDEVYLDTIAGAFPNYSAPLTSEPQFNLNSILIHADGSNSANNNTFQDSSSNAFSITRNGTPTQGTFSPFSQTGWSNYFNGSTDYLSVPSNANLTLGTSDFTIEFWAYWTDTSSTYPPIYDQRQGGNGAYPLILLISGVISYYVNNAQVIAGPTVVKNQWYHIAVARSSNVTKLFVNGVQAGSSYSDTTNYSGGAINIGRTFDGYYTTGYISNLRVIKGTAQYTSAFTPSVTPLTAISGTQLLTCQSNLFIDNSTNAYTITTSGTPSVQSYSPFAPSSVYSVSAVGGSYYLSGTSGEYFQIAQNNNFDLGTGSFTVECWMYPTSAWGTTYNGLVMLGTGAVGGGPYTGWGIVLNTSTPYIAWYRYDGTETSYNGTFNFKPSQWYHIAVCRDGSSNLAIFANGTRIYSGTSSVSFNHVNADPLVVGYRNDGVSGQTYLKAYVTNVRVIPGTAIYNPTLATCTVPTAPLSTVGNTQLLLSGTNAGIYDSTTKNNLLTGSTAGLSTTQSNFGGSSMYFDGTVNSAITAVPSTASLNPISNSGAFRAGDFTIECWVYPTASGGFQCFATNRNSVGGAGTWFFGLYTGSTSVVWYNGAAATLLSSALTVNNWYHVAVCRSGGTIKMFLNGALTGTNTAADTTDYSVGVLSIGYDIVETAYGFVGYIDEFRISRYARYTNTFTPSPSAFLNK